MSDNLLTEIGNKRFHDNDVVGLEVTRHESPLSPKHLSNRRSQSAAEAERWALEHPFVHTADTTDELL